MNDLASQHCQPCEGNVSPLVPARAQERLKQLDQQWQLNDQCTEIWRNFNFKNYYRTVAFVNAIAWIAHQENHHPDLEVSYNRCLVRYRTHVINGLSENDFICAAKVDAVLPQA